MSTQLTTVQSGPAPLAALTKMEHSVAVDKARLLAQSDVIPETFRDKPGNVLVALEYANRLGCSVLAVMQNLDVIYGRPSLRATFLIGTVNASGRFTPIRFEFQGDRNTDEWGCVAVATDRESGEKCIGPVITIGLAKAEGWYAKKGSKWVTMPEMMLRYRAAAWWTRLYAPELSLGLHSSDEAEDIGPSTPTPQQRIATIQAALRAPDPEPTGVEYATVVSETRGEPKGDRLDHHRKKYHAMLAERGMGADVDRHAFQKRLHAHALVNSESTKDWKVADYIGAIEELKAIEVVEEPA